MTADSRSAIWLSVEVAVAATALNALVGIPLAYLLARRRFWGRGLVDLLVTLPLVLPPTVTGYYLIVLLGRRGVLGAPLYQVTGWTIACLPAQGDHDLEIEVPRLVYEILDIGHDRHWQLSIHRGSIHVLPS